MTTDADRIKSLLDAADPVTRAEVFKHLRPGHTIHPLEAVLHARAEIILEAIHRAGGLTLRMIRGVIAEAAFDVEVAARLNGWGRVPIVGDLAYDSALDDGAGPIRVQVKLQRSRAGVPMTGNPASRRCPFSAAMFVAETQKTRAGKQKGGGSTRPYRFGEFDLLAVSMYPSTQRWDAFRFTVAEWLVPDPGTPDNMFKYQPVPPAANHDWTDDFIVAVHWCRSGVRKTISRGV